MIYVGSVEFIYTTSLQLNYCQFPNNKRSKNKQINAKGDTNLLCLKEERFSRTHYTMINTGNDFSTAFIYHLNETLSTICYWRFLIGGNGDSKLLKKLYVLQIFTDEIGKKNPNISKESIVSKKFIKCQLFQIF